MGTRLINKATLVVVGDVDLKRVCEVCRIVDPMVVEIDIDRYPSVEDLSFAIISAIKAYAPDLLVIATEDGDEIWDMNGFFEYRLSQMFGYGWLKMQ